MKIKMVRGSLSKDMYRVHLVREQMDKQIEDWFIFFSKPEVTLKPEVVELTNERMIWSDLQWPIVLSESPIKDTTVF